MIGKISIQTKMLLIIVSLIIVPKLILAIVDFLAASGKAAKTSTTRCGSPKFLPESLSLLICLCGIPHGWSNFDQSGQNSSQNRQDLVRICGL